MERGFGKMFRMRILQIVFVVMFVGFFIIPANAATTSTAPRIYSDFVKSPAYKNYTDFAKLYVSKYSIAIPGLEHTDVNGKDCTTMVPQGICFAKEYLIVSAYDSAEKCNSVLYVISNDDGRNRKLLMTVVLPMKAHVGGIAFDGTYLWVANGSKVSSIQYSTIVSKVRTAVTDKKKSVAISFHSTYAPATGASFITYGEGMLWVGQFKDQGDTSGKMYSYEVSDDGKKLTKKYCIQLPDRIQGACFKDGYLILSRSYSRNVSGETYISELRIYKISRPDQNGKIKKNSVVKVIKMPPMVEGLVAGSNYLYSVYESAATKYYKGTDGKGTCKYPVDRIVAFKFSDFIDNSNYFTKCEASYESIAKALESIGVDGSKTYRTKIAEKNGISGYTGTAEQNIKMLDLLKAGKLLKPELLLKMDERLVCFNANGGTGVMQEEVFRNGAALPNNNFTKKGYVFAGWATTADGEVVYSNNASVNLVESITLYAVWKPNQYILVYDANGGSGTMSNTTVTYGVSTAVRKPTFTRKGYTVAGWYRYRTSDDKWYYTSADGKTRAWYVEGKQPTGYKKHVMKTTSTVSITSAVAGDKVVLYAVWKKDNKYTSLDGKKVMFIGNSFIYYGGVVENGSQKKTDKGWFYRICKSNGENVSVYDCTYGGHHLYDFTTKGCKSGSCHKGKDLLAGAPLKSIDYVFISESGNNNANFIKDVKAVMKRFPSKTKFIYLCHSYTYSKNHKKILNKLSTLEDMGVSVVEWGKLVDDVIDGRTKVSGATVKYKKNTFIKNKGDTYHPNPLAGYITAQMAYCAVTGRSAVGQMSDVYKIGNDVKYGKSAVGYSKYISKHYKSSSSSNFKTVLKSKKDIAGLQKLMDKYLAKRNLGINAKK